MIALLATAWASSVEVEATSGYRLQTAGALVEDDLFVYTTSQTFPAMGRLRWTHGEGPAIEMVGAIDKRAPFDGERPQRWGGVRGMWGFQGRTPVTTTLTSLRVGAYTWDVRDVAKDEHEPINVGSLGLEVRRMARGRLQVIEADVYGNRELWGAELRTRVGFPIQDSGVFVTVGGATSRISAWRAADLLQVSYQLETSLLFAPNPAR